MFPAHWSRNEPRARQTRFYMSETKDRCAARLLPDIRFLLSFCLSLFFFLSFSVIYPLSPLRSVTKQVDGAAGGGVHVCVAGEFEPVPELPTFTTRESDQPTVPHLPKYQVHRYHIHNITVLNFEKHCY